MAEQDARLAKEKLGIASNNGIQDLGVHNFLSKFKSGFARKNRFRIEFYLPLGIQSGLNVGGLSINSLGGNIRTAQNNFNRNQEINIMCHTAQFPGKTLELADYKNLALPPKLPYFIAYDEITLSFYCDNEYNTREYFDIWFSTVFNVESKTTNYYNEYISDIRLYALDRYGNDTYGIVLENAYPVGLSAVDMGYDQNDEVQNIDVTFTYKKWYSITQNQLTQKLNPVTTTQPAQ